MSKAYNKDYFEDRKLKYEKNHGVFIHAFMFTEFSNRILGQCNVALNDLQHQLDAEIARAKAEEKRLDGKIDAETARATAEETRLDGKIDAETTRATGRENELNGKIDTEKTRLDGKIDAETARATERENELNNSINACLPKAGGTMSDQGLITWSHEKININADPFLLGGLVWEGASDYVSIKGDITGKDNMDLVVHLGDDNSNAIVFTCAQHQEVARIQSNGVYTGSVDWTHIINRPEIDKQTIDELKQICADLQARVAELEKHKA